MPVLYTGSVAAVERPAGLNSLSDSLWPLLWMSPSQQEQHRPLAGNLEIARLMSQRNSHYIFYKYNCGIIMLYT